MVVEEDIVDKLIQRHNSCFGTVARVRFHSLNQKRLALLRLISEGDHTLKGMDSQAFCRQLNRQIEVQPCGHLRLFCESRNETALLQNSPAPPRGYELQDSERCSHAHDFCCEGISENFWSRRIACQNKSSNHPLSASMSVFDGLGAAAAIIQFIGVGIKLSNKAIAVYKDKDRQEFASLKQQTNDFQTSTKVLVDNLHVRSTGPDSGEAMLMRIAEDCQQHAAELVQLIDSVQMKPEEKSIWNALKMTTKSEMKAKEIVAKRKELKQARHRCQEQLSLMLR